MDSRLPQRRASASSVGPQALATASVTDLSGGQPGVCVRFYLLVVISIHVPQLCSPKEWILDVSVTPSTVRSRLVLAGGLLGLDLLGCGSPLVDPQGAPLTPSSSHALPADAGPRAQAVPLKTRNINRVPASQLQVVDPTRGEDRYHEVQDGETLSQIARRYETTTEALRARNGLDSSQVRSGQQLYVPSPATVPNQGYTRD